MADADGITDTLPVFSFPWVFSCLVMTKVLCRASSRKIIAKVQEQL